MATTTKVEITSLIHTLAGIDSGTRCWEYK